MARPSDYVAVPELKNWIFEEGEEPRIKVRGLSSNEVYLAKEALAKSSQAQKIAKAVLGNGIAEAGEAIKEWIVTDPRSIANETRSRQELLLRGAIDEAGNPLFDQQDVARICEHFPRVFERLTNRIDQLSGESSADLGEKLRHSGETTKLEPPSSLPSEEASSSTSADPTYSPLTD